MSATEKKKIFVKRKGCKQIKVTVKEGRKITEGPKALDFIHGKIHVF